MGGGVRERVVGGGHCHGPSLGMPGWGQRMRRKLRKGNDICLGRFFFLYILLMFGTSLQDPHADSASYGSFYSQHVLARPSALFKAFERAERESGTVSLSPDRVAGNSERFVAGRRGCSVFDLPAQVLHPVLQILLVGARHLETVEHSPCRERCHVV